MKSLTLAKMISLGQIMSDLEVHPLEYFYDLTSQTEPLLCKNVLTSGMQYVCAQSP